VTYWKHDPRLLGLADGTVVTATSTGLTAPTAMTPSGNNTWTLTFQGWKWLFAPGGTASISRGDFAINSTSAAATAMFDLTGQTADGTGLIRHFESTQSSNGVSVAWDASGTLKVYDKANGVLWTSPTALPAGRVRIFLGATAGTTATNGTINVAVYLGANADGATPDWTFNSTTANTGTVAYTATRVGHLGQATGTTVTMEYVHGNDAQATETGLGALAAPTIRRKLLTFGGSTTDGQTFSTAAITPGANTLLLAAVFFNPTGTVPEPTLTGCGLTWVLVDNTLNGNNIREGMIYRAMGPAPSSGAVTIDFGAANVAAALEWFVVQYEGVDTSGSNGSGAIVQSANGRPTATVAPSQAFPNAVNAANEAFGLVGCATAQAQTPGSGWTQIAFGSQATPAIGASIETSNPPQQNVSATWATSTNGFLVGVEIRPGSKINKLKMGSAAVDSLYIGSQPVTAVYVGSSQVWP
jgi:hypothetical protein